MGDPYNNDERRPEVLSDLRTQLREAADSHRPDRERMLRRVEHGMAAPRPAARGGWLGRGGHRSPIGPAPWARVVGVTAGLVSAFAVGGLAVGLTTDGKDHGGQSVVTSPGPAAPPDLSTPTRSPTHKPVTSSPGTGGTTNPAPGTVHTPTGNPSAGASSSASPDTRRGNHPQDGYLWSDGLVAKNSNTFWAESDVTVKNEKPLTTLTVELRIALTGSVASTGSWSTLGADNYTVTITEDNGALVYHWTLKSGKTLAAGTYTFAGQYNHAKGVRDAGGDLYTARGGGTGGAVEVRGDFF